MRVHLVENPALSWVDVLPYVEFAINSTMNASTGVAPFTVVYGQDVILPLDLALSDVVSTTTAPDFAAHC